MTKPIIYVGASVAFSIGAYAAYRYIKSRESKCIDEGFEDVTKLEENTEKRILVLGLEGAGKSTLINRIAKDEHNRDEIKSTEGFNVTAMEHDGVVFNIWEVGGRESVRRYWSNFLQDTDLLVFVVDSSDTHNLPLAVKEMKTLLGDDRLSHVPVIVIASKKDKSGTMSDEEIAEAMDVHSIEKYKHKVKVIGTRAKPEEFHNDNTIENCKKAIINMCI